MNRLKELRENKGLSQLDLANKLKWSQQRISLYEQGREIKNKPASILADFINVDKLYLLGEINVNANDRSTKQQMIEMKEHVANDDKLPLEAKLTILALLDAQISIAEKY